MASRMVFRYVNSSVTRVPVGRALNSTVRLQSRMLKIRSVAPIRQFTSSFISNKKSVDEVLSVLKDEIKFEEKELSEKTTNSPENVFKGFDKLGFKVTKTADAEDIVELKKTEDGEEIVIRFTPSDVNSSVPEDQFPDEEFDSQEFMDEEDEGWSSMILPVKAYITKPSNGTLVFDGYVQDATFNIDQISMFKDSKVALSSEPEFDAARRSTYWGPSFQELDQRLQDAYYKYVTDKGLSDDLAALITEYAYFAESSLYLKSLKDIKAFIEA
ncbi:mitochondrial glycoprotein [Dipodascopsis uninucleata]